MRAATALFSLSLLATPGSRSMGPRFSATTGDSLAGRILLGLERLSDDLADADNEFRGGILADVMELTVSTGLSRNEG
jgi:hypothetical protein